MKGHKKHHHREAGGKVPGPEHAAKAGGEPQVFEEADKRKRGGKAKHHEHKHLGGMHGAKMKHRLDKPGRKMGGRAGSDRAPLSSAHKKSGGFDPD